MDAEGLDGAAGDPRGVVQRSGTSELAGEGPHGLAGEAEDALRVLQPGVDGRRGQARLQVGASLLEERRSGEQPPAHSVDALVRRRHLPRQQGVHASDQVQVHAGRAAVRPQELQRPQVPPHDLQPDERVDGLRHVAGTQRRVQGRLVPMEHRQPAGHGFVRPRGKAGEVVREPELDAERRIVRDQVLDETVDR